MHINTKYSEYWHKLPLLDEKEQLSLLIAYRNGNKIAKTKLILSAMRIVTYVIFKHIKLYSTHIDVEDLINQGWICLNNAIEKYNINSGVKLKTYMTTCVYNGLIRYIKDNSNMNEIYTEYNDNVESKDDVIDNVYKWQLNNELNNIFSQLSVKEQEIARWMFGCNNMCYNSIKCHYSITKRNMKFYQEKISALIRKELMK